MGQEIATTRFRAEDFERYNGRCKRELALLRTLLAQGRLSERGSVAGVELEAWLVDNAGQPRPINDAFLERHGPDLGALVRGVPRVQPRRRAGAHLGRVRRFKP